VLPEHRRPTARVSGQLSEVLAATSRPTTHRLGKLGSGIELFSAGVQTQGPGSACPKAGLRRDGVRIDGFDRGA